jgi:citrate synthase
VKKGLDGVIASETRLSDVQGAAGVLIFCGYDVRELAGKVGYEEVIYLMHHLELPTAKELAELKATLAAERELPQGVVDLVESMPLKASPMDVLRTAVSALGCFDPDAADNSMDANRRKAVRLIAKVPTIIASFHRRRLGLPVIPPTKTLGEAANFLRLINDKDPPAEMARAFDTCLLLHVDHGLNASTFAARVTIATLSDMYSAITSAIGTLKGPLHGGANEGVMKMLKEIGSPENVDAYVYDCLKQKKRIMGIGHRIYKTVDPRAEPLRRMALEMSSKIDEPKWVKMSDRIAEIVQKEKGLHPNVDFYSATAYYSMHIPPDLFTPIFAIARTVGWTAHVLEQLADNRLIRPESTYVGPRDLKVAPIEQR